MGKTGQSVFNFLKNRNYEVEGYDDASPSDIDHKAFKYVVKSPGVPLSHPFLKGKEVLSEFDFFRPNSPIIAITGTNGKSTMATLVHQLLKLNNIPTALGGNIGVPILDLPFLPTNGYYVLELSSFQLEMKPKFSIDIAIWLNFSFDHIDRHGTMEKYFEAKRNIFSYARYAMVCRTQDDEKLLPYLKIPHSFVEAKPQAVLKMICKKLHLKPDTVKEVCENFRGLPHRLQNFYQSHNFRFINDSKATNFEATGYALSRMPKGYDVHLILGGRLKNVDISPFLPFISKVRQVYIYGEACKVLPDVLTPHVPCKLAESLPDIFSMLNFDKRHKSVLLLSPGGSSYDQYRNFEERGKHFMELCQNVS